ncbi:MbnP family protein [Spirosoma pollinicola]|uniref:Copper-binding protein MbnP-like domain-containing protein n=1 Tax=Spirosoma pollinicola TaxID=2057025 RepID=A0A2K8Z9N4_9BACT|nr:MbnP family protein [Spirosoma pollinicola]AUD06583.1 hypothetical protein CWM47_34885 [Spirosoma pollinicola]
MSLVLPKRLQAQLLGLSFLIASHIGLAQQPLSIAIQHAVGDQNLTTSTAFYSTATGETFRVTLLQYYISNFQLVRSDGSTWTVPQDSSYFLIKSAVPASQRIRLPNVPIGEYTGIRFMIGVDSLRNTKHPSQRKGCLDIGREANGMYWSWNAGYIFFKLEGISPQAPIDRTSGEREFAFHVGQFGGMSTATPNNTRLVSISFPEEPLTIRANGQAQLQLRADLRKLFDGQHALRIADHSHVMMQPAAIRIADNYSTMFSRQ